MTWNWQEEHWPNFEWDSNRLSKAERLFAEGAGVIIGSSQHLPLQSHQEVLIELMSTEALDSSEIEGQLLNRISVQSSIRKELGLSSDTLKANPAEQGMAKMMVHLYQTIAEPLSHQVLSTWHQILLGNNTNIDPIGQYRIHSETMQIVSGPDYNRLIHFEAPPSMQVAQEMQQFLDWFESTSTNGATPLPSVTRSGIAHLWFESIHPFEDGNGRIGRAIAEKALTQDFSKPMITVLAKMLLRKRKEYYSQLGQASKTLNITSWLLWFACAAIEAQQHTKRYIEFIIKKSTLFNEVRDRINPRQEKALLRMFREGPEGFIGGLSAKNYMSITGAKIATATRDLQDLTKKNVLKRTGSLKATRYFLNIDLPKIQAVRIEDLL